jgi:hypothetical protein
MPPGFSVDMSVILWAVGAAVTALGAFYAVKYGQAETQRLVKALHDRFDRLAQRVDEIRIEQARLDERQKQNAEDIRELKKTQRFRLAAENGDE